MPRTLKPPAVPVPPPVCSLGSSMPLAELDRSAHALGSGTALAQTTHTSYYHPLNGGGGGVSSARSSMLRSSVSSASHARQGSIVPESPTTAQPPPPSFFAAQGSPSDHRPQQLTEASALMSSPATVPAPFASHAFQPQLPGVFLGAPLMAAGGPSAAAVPAAALQRHQRVASAHHHGFPVTAMTPAGADEKAMIVAERFRTRMCRHVEAGGACPYTNHCMFAHTSEQLRSVDANLADNITSEDAVREFQHRELVHARKARRVARRRAKLQLARAAKAREAGTDPLKGGSDHDESDHGEHDDDHSASDHSDHDVEPVASVKAATPEALALKKKGASPTEPQPKVATAPHPHHHHDPQRTVVAKAVVSPTEAAGVVQHHRPRVSTTPRQGGVAHPPPPAYSASSAATSPTNGTVQNASFVVTTAGAPCCNCQCHCHAHAPHPAPVVKVGSPVSSSSVLTHHASSPRAAPPVPHHHQQPQQPQIQRPVAAAPIEGSAAHQYGFASDYMAQLLQAQAQEYNDEEEADEGEWEEEQQPVQPAYYQGPQVHYASAAAMHPPVPVAPHVAFAQPHPQPHQYQFSGHYTAQPQQPVTMSRSHSHQNLAGPSHSHHWSPENSLGLGATAATMQQQQQLQYGGGFQQPTQPVVPSPTAGGARGVVMVGVGSKYQQPFAPSPPASTYAPTPKATTAGTPTAAGGETGSVHTAGGAVGGNPNYYPMCQVQSQQQLNHQLHDMMRYQQQQYQHHHQRQPSGQQLGHARSLSQVGPSNPLSPDTPTARSVASHPHSHHAGAHPHQQAVYDAARHIVLVETPVNGPDGVVRGSRTSWRHEPYDLLMPQHH